MELGSRFINAQVAEMIVRLGMHTWRLSDDERFFLHRYLYLSVLEAFKTLGIPYREQDPLLRTENVLPRQVPEFLRIPDDDVTELFTVKETNGHNRNV